MVIVRVKSFCHRVRLEIVFFLTSSLICASLGEGAVVILNTKEACSKFFVESRESRLSVLSCFTILHLYHVNDYSNCEGVGFGFCSLNMFIYFVLALVHLFVNNYKEEELFHKWRCLRNDIVTVIPETERQVWHSDLSV